MSRHSMKKSNRKRTKKNKSAGTTKRKRSIKPREMYTDDDQEKNKKSKININKLTKKYYEEELPEDVKDVIPYMPIEEDVKKGKGKTLLAKDVNMALRTGVGVAEDMGSLGMKVGKTAVKEVEGVGLEGIKLGKKNIKVGKKMLTKKNKKKKGSKNSYRSFLSRRLKEVKKAHPSWPQSKVFKEAVKGWKSSK